MEMISFVSGFIAASVIYYLIARRAEYWRKSTLISIHNGDAQPDENGNVGWLIK